MTDSLLAPNLLFRYAVPVRYATPRGPSGQFDWNDDYCLPYLRALEGPTGFARMWAAWHESGLGLAVEVQGKRQPLWCRDSRIEDSDSLQVWIDTRATPGIHRANRFCHRLAILPSGGGARNDGPMALALAVNRAREVPRPPPAGSIRLHLTRRPDGYRLEALITSAALTGFDPVEHPRLGFTYLVIDRELGWQTMHLGSDYPVAEDPSLWCTLELVGSGERRT